MKNKRILLLTTAFPPFEFSEGIVNAKLVLALKSRGHDVQVISRSATIAYAHSWSESWLPIQSQTHYPAQNEVNKLALLLQTLQGLLRYGYPVEGIRWGLQAEKLAAKLHQEKPFDLILSRMPSLFPHLLGEKLASAWKIPLISNWNDPTDDIRPLGHQVSRFQAWLMKRISRKVFQSANVNTFPSQELMEHFLLTNLKGLQSRVEIIPHIGFKPQFTLDYSKGKVVKIAHAGNMLSNINLDLLLAAFHNIAQRGLDFEFHVFGIVQDQLREKLDQLGLKEKIIIQTPLGYSEMVKKLVDYDYLLLLEAQYPKGILMLSKLSDYASLRKPIIAVAPKIGVTASYLEGEPGFYLMDNTNQEEIERGLETLIRKFPEIDSPSPSNRLWEAVNPEAIADRYESLFESLE
ncbi:hypothetical protein [Algoriphagus confluentis]|uniref:Glycosyltransferase subfamily 4-like N-terminal domain-containing protein n=1 Tax=Algoriphagus confluentis TaxID=1697556 RepID=A0ABQ6PNI3_9BACT|nr:hypothetical protein Aconfl_21840 [Algoriphagus confluentis]